MFGDSKSVVDSSMMPHMNLHKHHRAMSFHRVREAAIVNKIIGFYHIPREDNPANILSKYWGYQHQVWKRLLQPLLFWQGAMFDVLELDPKNTKRVTKVQRWTCGQNITWYNPNF